MERVRREVHKIKKLLESKILLLKIASGINPLDDTPIQEDSFLHNPPGFLLRKFRELMEEKHSYSL